MYAHNDMESLRLQLKHATELAEQQGGGVLVITEGVFGMKATTSSARGESRQSMIEIMP